ALDRTTWQPAWTWELPCWPSLTGQPPLTRLVNGTLLVGIARNDGYEIERLNPATGRPVGEAIAVGREPVDLAAAACDGDLLHIVADSDLRTIDCRRNREVRRRPLEPPTHWRIQPAAGGPRR